MRLRPLLVLVLVGAVAVPVAACATSAAAAEPRPYAIEVSDDAAAAARRAGFDLARVVARTADRVYALLPHRGATRIEVSLSPRFTVAGLGVGGTPDPVTGDVYLALDGDQPVAALRRSIVTWLAPTLARTLYLSSRIRVGPGYGTSLGAVLVTEGLSDHFVAQLLPRSPALPWDRVAMTAAQEESLWRQATDSLDIPGGYDHKQWFFGAGGDNALPRWAGYTLAYRVVAARVANGRSPAKDVRTPARRVYAAYAAAHA